MEITITLSEEDQSLQAEILKVLLSSDKSDKSDKSDETPKAAEQPTPKPYPIAGKEEKEEAPSDPSDTSDTSDPSDSSDTSDPSDPSDKAATPSDSSDKTALSMADLRKSVNAISRKKGLNWLYSWLGDLGVKSIADIPVARLEEAHTKLQNYA